MFIQNVVTFDVTKPDVFTKTSEDLEPRLCRSKQVFLSQNIFFFLNPSQELFVAKPIEHLNTALSQDEMKKLNLKKFKVAT